MQHSVDNKELLRLVVAGSVDDGKSTLIGRLLYETNSVYEDQLEAVRRASRNRAQNEIDFSFITDGLSQEREQGITIDVAYRYMATKHRKVVIADVPGHEEYTKNMITGASTAQVAFLMVDASRGVQKQTKRHLFIASLLGIEHIAVLINKMDKVSYTEEVFESIKQSIIDASEKLGIQDLQFIAISALSGENITTNSTAMSWYVGHSVLSYLNTVHIKGDKNLIDFRLPIQIVLREGEQRLYAGTVASGTLAVNETVLVLPSQQQATVSRILYSTQEVEQAKAGQCVAIELDRDLAITRGDMIVREKNIPLVTHKFEAIVFWMTEEPLEVRESLLLKHTTRTTRVYLDEIIHGINMDTLHREKLTQLSVNDIARVLLRTNDPVMIDAYKHIKTTGSFILIDEITHTTVGAGIVRTPSLSLPEIV